MRGLSLILVILIAIFNQKTDSPHGDKLDISCNECHTTKGWEIDRKNISFDHNHTEFQLVGLHQDVGCKSCHSSLVFSDADAQCFSCHTDMHQQTVGFDCGRCHTSNSWIVDNITEIHQQSRFPLIGAHITADCYDCHVSVSLLKFEPLGVECIDCHQNDYTGTTDPNHAESGFSTECVECHDMNAFSWSGSSFTHGFFPLTLGHEIADCSSCHTGTDYSNVSSECISCHQSDYAATSSPNHQQAGLSTECLECHTTNPGWKPADFPQHDNVFPIYSGEHNGEWVSCVDCHTDPNNYSIFTCIDCHEHNKNDMDDEHQGIGGYLYNSPACLECHPTGSGEGSFNHSLTQFPLTGAHTATECTDCHANGFTGTPTECFECHTPDFNASVDPNHQLLELSLECETCHTTSPDWQPATFDVHNDYYPLTGGHTSAECISCHETQYTGTPDQCFECHTSDFDQASNPNHVLLGLEMECEQCHTTNPEWKPALFDNHNDYHVLSGAHAGISNDCFACHEGNYSNTPITCVGCHIDDYNQTNDPSHASAQFSTDCLSCHTEFVWDPSTFDHDNQYFPIYSGKHQGEWNTCNECHTNQNNYALFSCIDCHEHNQADMDDEHSDEPDYVYNSIACLDCHPQGESKGIIRPYHINIR